MNFKETAKNVSNNRVSILEGRDKIRTSELCRQYPDGVNVVGFDIINGRKGDYAVVIFSEDDTRFYAGGKTLTDICLKWADMYGGDVSAASDALDAEGGVRMKFEETHTRDGRSYTRVTVLD